MSVGERYHVHIVMGRLLDMSSCTGKQEEEEEEKEVDKHKKKRSWWMVMQSP